MRNAIFFKFNNALGYFLKQEKGGRREIKVREAGEQGTGGGRF